MVDELTIARFVVEYEYDLFGGVEPKEYITEILAHAVNDEKIKDFNLISISRGIFGLVLIVFTVDIHLSEDIDYIKAKELGASLLTDIIQDSVDIRWVANIKDYIEA